MDLATIDVAFISLTKVLGVISDLLIPRGEIIALIKPQFEAGREHVGKHGIVKDPKIHERVIQKVIQLAVDNGFSPMHLDFSPITGGEGNIEFLIHLKSVTGTPNIDLRSDVSGTVASAHRILTA